MADNSVFILPLGLYATRQMARQMIQTQPTLPTLPAFDLSRSKPTVFGDTAIVTGVMDGENLRWDKSEEDKTTQTLVSSTHIKRKRGWQPAAPQIIIDRYTIQRIDTQKG